MTNETALKTYRDVLGQDPDGVLTPAEEFAFGTVWHGSELTRRERYLTALVCIAWSNDEASMKRHAYGALATGELTIDELLEWVLHFAIYCGWPKASTAEGAITAAYDQLRADRGEEVTELPALEPGDAHLGLVDWDERLAAGRETFLEVNGLPAPTVNSPYRNSGIVGFVFGHLWRRPALNHRERRFITVPCVMVEGAHIPMLNHVGSALESGHIGKPQMDDVIQTIAAYSGLDLANKTSEFAEDAWARISDGRGWMSAMRG